MITKEQKVRLGIFLIVSLLLLTVVTGIFILPKLKDNGDEYYIDFREMSVNGVNNGADVKYQGVRIGKVSRIDVNPSDLRSVLIYIKIKKGFPVKKNMRATLQYAGITGLRFVEISGGITEAESLMPGGRIMTKKGLGEKAEDIVLNIDSVVDAVNNLLNEDNQKSLSLFIKNMEKSTSVLSKLMEDKQQHLGNSIENIDKVSGQLHEVTKNLNEFTVYLNTMTSKISPQRIDKMITETSAMVDNIARTFSDKEIGKVLKSIDSFVEASNVSVRKMESSFHDLEAELSKTLASLRESMENISRLTRELTEDPTSLLRKRAGKRSRK